MKVTRILQPGARGTKRYQRLYGDRLVCVRYRRDENRGRRLTTVELVVAQRLLRDDPPDATLDERIHPNQLVFLRIEYHEQALRARVKSAGATWVRTRRARQLHYGDALDLGLRDRVIDDTDMDI